MAAEYQTLPGDRKRRRLVPSSDRIGRLLKRVSSVAIENSEDVTDVFEHLALLSSDIGCAVEVCRHAEWKAAWKHFSDIICSGNRARGVAFDVALNILAVPELQSYVWATMERVAASEQGTAFLVSHRDIACLAELSLRFWDTPDTLAPLLRFLTQLFEVSSTSGGPAMLALFLPRGLVEKGDLQKVKSADLPCALPLVRRLGFGHYVDAVRELLKADPLNIKAWLWVLVEGMLLHPGDLYCFAAFGNFVKDTGMRDALLSDDALICRLWTACAAVLRSIDPGDKANEVVWAIFRTLGGVLPHQPMTDHFRKHLHALDIIYGCIRTAKGATVDDLRVLVLLRRWASDPSFQDTFTDGANLSILLQDLSGILIKGIDNDLRNTAIDLLMELCNLADGSAIVAGFPKEMRTALFVAFCGTAKGKELLNILMPVLQWCPELVQALPLKYKREWTSNQIKQVTQQVGQLDVVIFRDKLLDGLCDRLHQPTAKLRQGINVRFSGDGENGIGDGHRREFFQLASKELTDPSFGLFKSDDGERSFHISSTAAAAQPDHVVQM